MAAELGAVRSEADVSTADDNEEQDDFGEEPGPRATLRGRARKRVAAAAARVGVGVGVGLRPGVVVQVERLDRNNVVVVAQLARLGAEAQVRNVGQLRRAVHVEARLPFVLVLVLQLQLQVLVLEVRQAHLGGHRRVADAARRAARQLRVLAVVVLVVVLVAVAVHRHDVGEHHARAVVLVRVDKDAQAVEAVTAAKDGPHLTALAGDPHGEAVAEQLVLARDPELDLDLPVGGRQRHAGEEPAALRGSVRGKTDVAVVVGNIPPC